MTGALLGLQLPCRHRCCSLLSTLHAAVLHFKWRDALATLCKLKPSSTGSENVTRLAPLAAELDRPEILMKRAQYVIMKELVRQLSCGFADLASVLRTGFSTSAVRALVRLSGLFSHVRQVDRQA